MEAENAVMEDNAMQFVVRKKEKKAILVKCNSKSTEDVVIPAEIANCAVISLGTESLSNNSYIHSIKCAENSALEKIEGHVLWQLQNLGHLSIPAKCSYIHPNNFHNTPKLTSITVSEANRCFKIIDDCLYTHDLEELVFVPRDKINTFVIKASVKEIRPYALENCVGIRKISIEPGCQLCVLGNGCLSGTHITEFVLPNSITYIGDSIFLDCKSLKKIAFEPDCAIRHIPHHCFSGTRLASVTIPRSVTTLGSRCFGHTTDLKTVSFESNSELVSIEEDVFWSSGIEVLFIENTKCSISAGNFFFCKKLREINLPADHVSLMWEKQCLVDKLNTMIYTASRLLERIQIPDSIEVICDYAFCHCEKLSSISLTQASRLKRIGKCAFSSCKLLTRFDVPQTVTVIDSDAFSDCVNLSLITFQTQSALTSIGRCAFARTRMHSVALPASVVSIGDMAFSASAVRSIAWPPHAETINHMSFYHCKNLEYISFTGNRLRIARDAFDEHPSKTVLIEYTNNEIKFAHVNVEVVKVTEVRQEEFSMEPISEPCFWSDLIMDRMSFEYLEERPLGAGGQGTVRRVRHKESHKIAIFKELYLKDADYQRRLEFFWQEVKMLTYLAHPSILGIIGFIGPDTEHNPILITEYMPNRSLDCIIYDAERRAELTPTIISKMVVSMIYGLRHIHKTGACHRDFKPGNIMIDANWEVKIGDLGSAKAADMTETGHDMTTLYTPPEVLRLDSTGAETRIEDTSKIDIYAFTLTLWELLVGDRIANSKKILDIRWMILDGWRPDANRLNVPWLREFVALGWHDSPEKRPTADEAIQTMKEMKWTFTPEPPNMTEVQELIDRIERYEAENSDSSFRL